MWKQFALLILLFFTLLEAQSKIDPQQVDSLERVVANGPDSLKVEALLSLCKTYRKADSAKALSYARNAVELAKRFGDRAGEAEAYWSLSKVYAKHGQNEGTMLYGIKAADLKDSIGLREEAARLYFKMGSDYYGTSDYVQSTEMNFKALKIYEALEDSTNMGMANLNLGNNDFVREHYEQALLRYEKAEQLFDPVKEENFYVYALGNLGMVYEALDRDEEALEYYNRALAVNSRRQDTTRWAMNIVDIGKIYLKHDSLEAAMNQFEIGLEMLEATGYKYGIDACHNSMGLVLQKQGDLRGAYAHFAEGLEVAKEIQCMQDQEISYREMANVQAELGNFEEAYRFYLKYHEVKEAIVDERALRQMNELEAGYESEKREIRIAALEKDKEQQAIINEAEANWFTTIIIAVSAGLALVVLFSIFLYRRFRHTKRQNTIIEEQKEEVELQKELVEEKNKEITDSITYAKRIQEAILPPDSLVKEHLPDSFIYYRPKDIVAGDFYWVYPDGGQVYFAAADCTGHGVPGAMVSVVCSNALNRAVKEFELKEPGQILDKVTDLVIETFEKSEDEVKDGMDIGLCRWDKATNQLMFAGANNPIWLFRKRAGGENLEPKAIYNDFYFLEEYKGDKQPIGKYANRSPFTTRTFSLRDGDVIYLLTDGFADQFGGPKEGGKKFKYTPFKKLLLSMHDQPMEQREAILSDAFEAWKGSYEQVDDVCVFGVKV